MPDPAPILKRLREILSIPGDRVGKARRISTAIRETYGYGWVGVFDVTGKVIDLVAWSGNGPPIDPRSLDHPGRSEMLAIVLGPAGGLAGFLGAAKDPPDSLGAEDQQRLEDCVRALAPLWGWDVP
jgi:hypothetical protein